MTGINFNRRNTLVLGAAALAAGCAGLPDPLQPVPSNSRLPRWRGFNLLNKFTLGGNRAFEERDFVFLAANGFNFARLPLDYRIWTETDGTFRKDQLKEIDAAVHWGRRYGIHVCICLHRAPGYCIGLPKEPLDLWGEGDGSDEARRRFAGQWTMFAKRYHGISNAQVSFNLVNEPPNVSGDIYRRGVEGAVKAIRKIDPNRLIICDGHGGGHSPTPELAALSVAQSGRGYMPFQLTHYKAAWVEGSDKFPLPDWPLTSTGNGVWDKARLQRDIFDPWLKLRGQGTGVMIGEWGCFNQTPHAVALAWMKDNLAIFQEAGLGWALWNLRGPFGPCDSERSDVTYTMQDGMKIDTDMLALLKSDA